MKEHEHPYWHGKKPSNDNSAKPTPTPRLMRAVPAHVNDEVGIRRHIYSEMERMGLPKPKGELKKVPLSEIFKGAD